MLQNKFKTALTAVFLIIPLLSFGTSKKATLVSTPDFAFPKSVISVAEANLNKNLKEKNYAGTLRDLLNLTVAQSLVSNDSTILLLDKIDSLANKMPSPYKELGLLIEGQIYADIYRRNQFFYDRRTAASYLKDSNPQFWDKNMFADKIDSLVSEALKEKDITSRIPLVSMGGLISHTSSLSSYFVYDFIVYKSLELINTVQRSRLIPFYSSVKNENLSPRTLTDGLIDLHSEISPALANAILVKFNILKKDNQNAREYLWQQVQAFGNYPEAYPLIEEFYNSFIAPLYWAEGNEGEESNFNDFYIYIESLIKESGTKPDFRNSLKRITADMSRESVSLTYPNLVVTDSEVKVKAANRNIKNFYIHILRIGDDFEKNRFTKEELASLPRIASVLITKEGRLPFFNDTTVDFRIEKPGRYILIASRNQNANSIIGENKYFYPSPLIVSDIDLISVNEINSDDKEPCPPGIFVVNATDGRPLSGAKVEFNDTKYYPKASERPLPEHKVTGKEGFATSSFTNALAKVSYNGSKSETRVNSYQEAFLNNGVKTRLFPDRQICRPGDTIKFFGIAYEVTDTNAFLRAQLPVTVKLRDANNLIVDSVRLVANQSGRFFGQFTLPSDGLLGSWTLATDYSTASFEVAPYKTPSFLLSLQQTSSGKDSVSFIGKAATYTGMPLAYLKVNFRILYKPPFIYYRASGNEEEFSSYVTTDSNGDFLISLPIANLKSRTYNGIFIISASATDEAGETVESAPEMFFVTDTYSIYPDISNKIKLEGYTVNLHVSVRDNSGQPVNKEVEYKISGQNGIEVMSGIFTSPVLSLNAKDISSGKYEIKFKIEGENSFPTVAETVFYRLSDSVPPVITPLWVPEEKYIVNPDEKTVKVHYGSSYEGQYILCFVSDSKGNLRHFWEVSDGKNSFLEIPVPEEDTRVFLTLTAYREHNFHQNKISIIPSEQIIEPLLKTRTFRDALQPGQQEKWQFVLTMGDNLPTFGYAYALLYDKSLDAISPLRWNTNLFTPYFECPVSLSGYSRYSYSENFTGRYEYLKSIQRQYFDFNTYGYPLYSVGRNVITNLASSRASGKAKMALADVADDYVTEETLSETAVAGKVENGESMVPEDREMRPIELPVAFFKPDLNTNDEGEIQIKFTVPDFPATWNLILGAYTPELKTAELRLETKVSKKIMVKMFVPRFIRTGDRVSFTANIFNNTVEEADLRGIMELFDPGSNKIISQNLTEGILLEPYGKRMLSIEYECPVDIDMLGIRVYGEGKDSSDGEQTVIPVLPSSTPVTDAYTFYIRPSQKEFDMTLPEFNENSSVTLSYCDNPAWEALTALSPLVNTDSNCAITLASALYSSCVSSGLLNSNENLKEGLKLMFTEKADGRNMASPLENNINLKTVSLNNTPWVNNARSETLRLANLSSLFDEKSAEKSIEDIWERLLSLRNTDGGWSWCPGMKSNIQITKTILSYIGKIRQNGYMPEIEGMLEIIKEALLYVEKAYVEGFKNITGKKDSYYFNLISFLYLRSYFDDMKEEPAFLQIKKAALKYLKDNWRGTNLDDKVSLSMVLYRAGYREESFEILESLRQFSSYNPEKGAWFDNLNSDRNGLNKLLITSKILSVFNELKPGDEIIDRLRQWLLLQKQTQEWQEGAGSIEVINSLITSGRSWSDKFDLPEIKIGKKTIMNNELSRLTGSIDIDLDPIEFSGTKIHIVRESPSPAWGGIICQHIEPIKNVVQHSVEGLSISKQIWKIIDNGNGVEAVTTDTLAIGDKARVALIIESDKDMDFVAVTDSRGAALEPTNTLSEYTVIDGVWCYREIQNSSSNIFFEYLPKGRHLITYDCFVTEAGIFSAGVAEIQCQYYPAIISHSEGKTVVVDR